MQIVDFAPFHAALGGALLGTATIMRMWLHGQVLGVSGVCGGLARGRLLELPRWSFTAGLVAAGVGLKAVYPTALGDASVAPWREALGGLAVGLGAALGNGCTSGHGISGNARLSPRSMAYTLTFMGAGFVTASLLHSAAAITVLRAPEPPVENVVQLAAQLLVAHLAAYASAVVLARAGVLPAAAAATVTAFLDGTLFGCGLGLSGMTSPARVAQFLDVSAGEWNPTLAFVMAGALGLVAPFMLGMVMPRTLSRPLIGAKFELPTNKTIDRKLLTGGLLFGAGWGIGGMCPGPALVALANPSSAPFVWVGAMVAGIKLADVPAVAKYFG